MAHGYYNLQGTFVTTSTRAEATNAWRKERGYSTGGVYDMGGGEVIDAREKPSAPKTAAPVAPAAAPATQSTAPATPGATGGTAYNVQAIQSTQSLAPGQSLDQRLYDTQAIQSLAAAQQSPYDVQSIQSSGAPARPVSGATPTEQAAAQGGGVPSSIDAYLDDPIKSMYKQWPYSAGGIGTPTELRYGQKDIEGDYAGYGPSSYQWSESPGSLAELAQGRTPPGPALRAADTVDTFLQEWGIRPGFVTPFVAQSLGLSAANMKDMGYVEDLYGQWIALEFGEEELVDGGDYVSGGGYGGGYGGGHRGSGSYSSPAGFRSAYTSGLINWKIGF